MYKENEVVFGSIHDLEAYLRGFNTKWTKVYVLVDENTQEHCLPSLFANQDFFSHAEIILVEPGEGSKDLEVCYQVWGSLLETGADRNSLLVTLGGGMISDLGGFIASTFKRGMDFIHVPTTLMGQVDAAIGGKTGINFEGVKNQIGTFAKPLVTYIDDGFLETLPEREYVSGLAEVIKYGLTFDAAILEQLPTTVSEQTKVCIQRCVAIKQEIVANDYKEEGERKKLNFGHTIGHAVEAFFEGEILHGEAVAAGLLTESYLSYKVGYITEQELNEIVRLVYPLYTPLDFSVEDMDTLIGYMQKDKKNTAEGINFTLLNAIGSAVINQYVSQESIREALGFYILLNEA